MVKLNVWEVLWRILLLVSAVLLILAGGITFTITTWAGIILLFIGLGADKYIKKLI